MAMAIPKFYHQQPLALGWNNFNQNMEHALYCHMSNIKIKTLFPLLIP